ncbi:MAG: hypothetical protein M1813_005189 [Trichoglossum hirsutum]|nr:MAG: hypothetical protein M1813_005189 [Trichoglossum hirsutum]
MGRKNKRKNGTRMPISQGQEGVATPSSSPEDSTTNLERSSGSPENIVNVDSKDKQTPGELTDNMSNALSQVDSGALNHSTIIIALSIFTDSYRCYVVKPEGANSSTTNEGSGGNDNQQEETTPTADANSTENPSNEVATTTTIVVENTKEENVTDNKSAANPEPTPVEENEGSSGAVLVEDSIAGADTPHNRTAATGDHSKEEGTGIVEDAVSSQVAASEEASGGKVDGAEGSDLAAEANSIEKTISNEDTSTSEEVAVTNTKENPPADPQGAAVAEKIVLAEDTAPSENATSHDNTPDGEPGVTLVEEATITDKPPHAGEVLAIDNSTSSEKNLAEEGTLSRGDANDAEETETREIDTQGDVLGGAPTTDGGTTESTGSHKATKDETTTPNEPSILREDKQHITEHAEIEPSLDEVDPLVSKSLPGSHTQGQTLVELILEAVEPEVHQTDDHSPISATEVEAVLDEVTPDLCAGNEDDNNSANTESTGGQAESTDDAGSNEDEVTRSDITAPTTAAGSVCGDSTASEGTAATEDTTVDDASADKTIITREEVSVTKDGTSTEGRSDAETTTPVEASQLVGEVPVVEETSNVEGATPPDEERNTRRDPIEASTKEPPVEEANPINEPAIVEDTPAGPSAENSPAADETPTKEDTPLGLETSAAAGNSPIADETPTREDTPLGLETSAATGNSPTADETPTREDTSLGLENSAADLGPTPVIEASATEPRTSVFVEETPIDKPQTPSPGECPLAAEPEISPSERVPPAEEFPAAGPDPSATESEAAPTGETAPTAVPEAHITEGPPTVEQEISPTEPETAPSELAASSPGGAPTTQPRAFSTEPEILLTGGVMASAEADIAVEDGPSGEQTRDATAGDPPASPTTRRRRLHWSPENGDETLLEHIIRPHRARRESDASVFTVKAGKSMPDTVKHHHRRRESGASGHSRVDRDSLKKKARTPEEEEERRKRKEAKEAMSPEEREERRKRKEARRSQKEPDQFSVGSHSGDKDNPDKPRHRQERRENNSTPKPPRPKLLSVFSAESDFKVPILWINAGTTEVKDIRPSSHPPSPKSPKSPKSHRHTHHGAEREAHRSRREGRKRETEDQDAQELEQTEEKRSPRVEQETPHRSGHHKHGTKERHREHHREHHRSHKRGKDRVADGDSPITVFRKVMTRELKNFFLQ